MENRGKVPTNITPLSPRQLILSYVLLYRTPTAVRTGKLVQGCVSCVRMGVFYTDINFHDSRIYCFPVILTLAFSVLVFLVYRLQLQYTCPVLLY